MPAIVERIRETMGYSATRKSKVKSHALEPERVLEIVNVLTLARSAIVRNSQ